MPDKLEILYNAGSEKFELGTLEEFRVKMRNPAKQKRLYDAMSKDFNIGSFGEFQSKLKTEYKPPENQVPKLDIIRQMQEAKGGKFPPAFTGRQKEPGVFFLPEGLTGDAVRERTRRNLDFSPKHRGLPAQTKDDLAAVTANAVEFLPGGEITQQVVSGMGEQPASTLLGFGIFLKESGRLAKDLFKLTPAFTQAQRFARDQKHEKALAEFRKNPLYLLAAALMLRGGANALNKRLSAVGPRQFLKDAKDGKVKIPEAKEVIEPFIEKQPWQTTKSEWLSKKSPQEISSFEKGTNPKKFKKYQKKPFASREERFGEFHRQSILEALSRGEEVPTTVLRDYPEIQTLVKKEPSGGLGGKFRDLLEKEQGKALVNAVGSEGAKLKASPPRLPTVGTVSIAKIIEKDYDKQRAEIRDLSKPSVKKAREYLATKIVDASANVKNRLLKEGGEAGKRAVIYHDLVRGASARAALESNKVSNKIYKGLSKQERYALDQVVDSRSSISNMRAKEGLQRRFTEGQYEVYLKSLDPVTKAKIMPLADAYFEVPRKMLKRQLDHGIISKEVYDALKGREYERSSFIDKIDPQRTYGFGGKKITVRDSGIRSLKEGSEGTKITDSQLLITDLIARTESRIAKQKANQQLYRMAKENPKNSMVIIPKNIKHKPPNGYETIFVMEKGQPKPMFMHRELAKEWVTTDPQITADVQNWGGWFSGTKVLKTFATGINPEFAVANFPRDIAHIFLTTKQYSSFAPKFLGQMATDLAKVAPDAFLRKGRYKDYVKQGGGMEFLTHQGIGGLTRTKSKYFPKLEPVFEKFDSLKRTLGYLGESSELWTRLALRERALKRGLDPIEATWEARNYLDFAQGGSFSKFLDIGLPYFNAGIQGTRGIFRAARREPRLFTSKVAQIGAMATGLYLANRAVNKEAWDQISEHDKRNNWIFTLPLWIPAKFRTFEGKKGRRRHLYIRIAKDQGQRFFATTAEALMEKYLDGTAPTDQVIESLWDAMPAVPTSAVPPTGQAILGYAMNKDFWRNDDIWKGREVDPNLEFTPYTHDFFVQLGEKTEGKSYEVSPARMQRSLEAMLTSGNIYTYMVGSGFKAIMNELPEEQQDKVMAQILTEQPFLRKSLRATNPYKDTKAIKEGRIEAASVAVKQERKLDELADQHIRGKIDRKAVFDFIHTQPRYDQEKLRNNFKEAIRMKDVEDWSWWRQLRGVNPPEARANIFFVEWEKSSPEDKKKLEKNMRVVPRFSSKRFLRRFNHLKTSVP